QAVERPPKRPGAEFGIEALPCEEPNSVVRERDLDLLGTQAPREPVEQQPRDVHELILGQRAEHDDLADPVDELRAEAPAQYLHQVFLQLVERLALPRVLLDAGYSAVGLDVPSLEHAGGRVARAGRDLERIGAGARLTQVVQVDRVRGWNAVDRRVSREGDVGSGFGELRHVQTLDVPAARVIHDVAGPVGSVEITPRDEAAVDAPTGRIVG